MGNQEKVLTIDGDWENKVIELAKTDPLRAYDETQKVLCRQFCDRKECNQDCAFVRRVIRHVLVIASGGKLA